MAEASQEEESTREREQADGSGGGRRDSSEHSDRSSSRDLLHCTVSRTRERKEREAPLFVAPADLTRAVGRHPKLSDVGQPYRQQSPRLDIRRCSSVSTALLSCSSERPSHYAPPDRRSRPVFAPPQKPGVRLTARQLSVARCGVDKSSEHFSTATECSTTRADSKDAVATAWLDPHHGRRLSTARQ